MTPSCEPVDDEPPRITFVGEKFDEPLEAETVGERPGGMVGKYLLRWADEPDEGHRIDTDGFYDAVVGDSTTLVKPVDVDRTGNNFEVIVDL